MVYMCSGQTTHTVNGSGIVLKEGEMMMLGQNAVQSVEPAGEGDVAVNFIVRPAFFSGTLFFLGEEETPLRRFVVSCLTGENEAGYLLFHVADILPIQNLIENLLYTLTEQIPNRRGILQSTMGLLSKCGHLPESQGSADCSGFGHGGILSEKLWGKKGSWRWFCRNHSSVCTAPHGRGIQVRHGRAVR